MFSLFSFHVFNTAATLLLSGHNFFFPGNCLVALRYFLFFSLFYIFHWIYLLRLQRELVDLHWRMKESRVTWSFYRVMKIMPIVCLSSRKVRNTTYLIQGNYFQKYIVSVYNIYIYIYQCSRSFGLQFWATAKWYSYSKAGIWKVGSSINL